MNEHNMATTTTMITISSELDAVSHVLIFAQAVNDDERRQGGT